MRCTGTVFLVVEITAADGRPAELREFGVVVRRPTHGREDRAPEFGFSGQHYSAPVDLNKGRWERRCEGFVRRWAGIRAATVDPGPLRDRMDAGLSKFIEAGRSTGPAEARAGRAKRDPHDSVLGARSSLRFVHFRDRARLGKNSLESCLQG